MIIQKARGFLSDHYDIYGLTPGEIIAIRNALQSQRNQDALGAVGRDVLIQIDPIYLDILKVDND